MASRQHWLARASLGYVLDAAGDPILNAAGKPKRDYKDFTSTDSDGRAAVQKARAWVEGREAERHAYGRKLDHTLTCDQWFEKWIRDVQPEDANNKSRNADRSQYVGHARPVIGALPVAQVRKSHIQHVWKAMDDKGLSPASKTRLYWTLKKMFGECQKEYKIPSVMEDVKNPGRRAAQTAERRQAVSRARDAIPVEDVFKILDEASSREQGTKWWMSILQGLRQGERLGATWEQLDTSDRDSAFYTLTWQLAEVRYMHGCGVQRLDGSWPCKQSRAIHCESRTWDMRPDEARQSRHLEGTWWLRPPKRDSFRRFPLVPQLRDALLRYRERTADEPNPFGLIWHRPGGAPWTAPLDSAEWTELLLAAGVISEEQAKPARLRAKGTPPPPTTHFTRHTNVSALQELGVPELVIMSITGHTQLSSLRGYSHVASQQAQEAVRKLGERFGTSLQLPK